MTEARIEGKTREGGFFRCNALLGCTAAALLLTGCARTETTWVTKYGECLSEAHRDKAAAIAKTFLAATPSTIAGDDQDWEDAVIAAAAQGRYTACPPTLWEYRHGWMHSDGSYTGNVKYAIPADSDDAVFVKPNAGLTGERSESELKP